VKPKNIDLTEVIKKLSREEFDRKPTKVWEQKKRDKRRLTTKEILELDEDS
jgi:hypothetical protein